MICKRCGASLPSIGFLCTNCGFMMDAEQIKKQKELMKLNKQSKNIEMLSTRYGYRDNLYENREKEKRNFPKVLLLLFLFLFFLVCFALFIFNFLGKNSVRW